MWEELYFNFRGLMEIIGILVGHLYFFLMFKYPQDFGGRRFISTPQFLWVYPVMRVKRNHCVSVSWKSYILSQDLNPFHASGLFLYPLKTRGFLMFSGGIERDQWHEMCYGLGLKYNFFKKHLHNYSRGIEWDQEYKMA